MIREVLDLIEPRGVVALQLNGAAVRVFTADSTQSKPSKYLVSHALYLTAVLGTHDRIDLSEVRRLLGYKVERPATYRETLMERAGWPSETLTLEELEAL